MVALQLIISEVKIRWYESYHDWVKIPREKEILSAHKYCAPVDAMQNNKLSSSTGDAPDS